MRPHPGLLLLGLLILGLGGFLYYSETKQLEISAGPIPNQTALIPWEESPGKIETKNHTYLIEAAFRLKNERDVSISDIVYVLVPMNTTYQMAKLVSIEPKPLVLETDENGNTYAKIRVELGPNEVKWINATFLVEMMSYKHQFNPKAAKWPPLEIAMRYTTSTVVWATENETLIRLAEEIAGDEQNPLRIARKIAEWVLAHLEYKVNPNVTRGSGHCLTYRNGELRVFGDCTEVADIYITLARILGIPARAAFGMMLEEPREYYWLNESARGEGEELLTHWGGHIWPQVYMEPWGWIDVEMLEGLVVRLGDYSWRHIVFGLEEKNFYQEESAYFCVSMYLEVEHMEFRFIPKG